MSIYRRGAVFWWRRRLTVNNLDARCDPVAPPLGLPAARSIILRISLKTTDRSEAKRRGLSLDVELEMVAVTMPERVKAPAPKQLASIYQEALRFKIDQIERLQSRPPFDDNLHAAFNKAYALLFACIARTGDFPEAGTSDADQLLRDDALTPPERKALAEILQIHSPTRCAAAFDEVASERAFKRDGAGITAALGYPVIAPRLISNYLENAGLEETPENRSLALTIAASAYGDACNRANGQPCNNIDEGQNSVMPSLLARIVFGNQNSKHGLEGLANPVNGSVSSDAKIQDREHGGPTSPLPAPLEVATSSGGLIDLTISQLCAQAVQEMSTSGAWRDSAQRNAKVITEIFIAVNGDLRMSEINRPHLVALHSRLKSMPQIWGKSREDRQGGLKAVFKRGDELAAQWAANADKAKQQGLPKVGLSAATHNRHINTLGQLFNFARGLEDADGNKTHVHPRASLSNLTQADKRRKNRRKPVPQEAELRKLLSGPLFSGCKDQDNRFQPGPLVIHDGGYWVPLMLPVYGARSNELCQMPLMDVFEGAPIPYFEIRADTGREVKTQNSVRSLPIAPNLIDLNFIDYVQALKERGERWLFPEFNQTQMKPRKVFRDRFFSLLLDYHFPQGTSARMGDKDIDTQSIRKIVATQLRKGEPNIDLGIRQYFFGHAKVTTIEEIYEDDPSLEELLVCVIKTQKLIDHINPFPLRLRNL